MSISATRRAWPIYETWHAVVYFSPEVAEAFKAVGLKGWWMGYFAGRSAPLGPAPAGLVQATFYNFHPDMVARAIPDAWQYASPEAVLEARLRSVDATLRRLVPGAVDDPAMVEAASLAQEAALAPPADGRPLYGALRSLSWPEEPHLALWHAATLLREHRGDGHNAVLVSYGVDGCGAHVLQSAAGRDRSRLQAARHWSDDEWDAAAGDLEGRGWLSPDAALTPAGREIYDAIERVTDERAEGPWETLGAEGTERLLHLWAPWSRLVAERGGVPQPNPVGVPPP